MASRLSDLDTALQQKLREYTVVPIIIEFYYEPKLEQIDALKEIGIDVRRVLKPNPLVSAVANESQIGILRRRNDVKKIWLDSKSHVPRKKLPVT
jgi:hypothetical protein